MTDATVLGEEASQVLRRISTTLETTLDSLVSWSPTSTARETEPDATHTLLVIVHSAKQLKDTQLFTSQDPYAKVVLEETGETRQSKCVENGGTEPEFTEVHDNQLRFILTGICLEADLTLHVELWNDNSIIDDLIGRLCITLHGPDLAIAPKPSKPAAYDVDSGGSIILQIELSDSQQQQQTEKVAAADDDDADHAAIEDIECAAMNTNSVEHAAPRIAHADEDRVAIGSTAQQKTLSTAVTTPKTSTSISVREEVRDKVREEVEVQSSTPTRATRSAAATRAAAAAAYGSRAAAVARRAVVVVLRLLARDIVTGMQVQCTPSDRNPFHVSHEVVSDSRQSVSRT